MKFAWSALVLALAFAASSQDEFKKIVPDVEGAKRSSRKLSKEARERVEKAIERKLDDKEANVAIWEGRGSVPEANQSEKVRILYTVLTAKGPKGEFKVAVAVAPEERVIAGVRVLENKDDPAAGSDDFLLQFDQYRYTADLWTPGSALSEVKQASAARKDERSKQIDGIFKLMSIMHPVEPTWWSMEAHLDSGDKTAADEAERIAKSFGDTEPLVADFGFLKTSSADSFRRRLKEGIAELRKLSQHAKAGKFVEARAVASEVRKSSCTLCHAGNERVFRIKRAELGIGNGFFTVGHDVKTTVPATASHQAVASAIRLAVLILSEAK